MTTIAAVRIVLPRYRYTQEEITNEFGRICLPGEQHQGLLERLHRNAKVVTRHLALPLERYAQLSDFTGANDAFLDAAVELGSHAVAAALEAARIAPQEVDFVMSTTVTGIAIPSLDARIAARLGLRPDVKRIPLMGLGCMAGAAGLARLSDVMSGTPTGVGVLVSVELCSLTVQREDATTANLIASGLFGDGAAAAVLVGRNRKLPNSPEIIDSRSHLYPGTERAMGWDVGAHGLRIILGAEVPSLVETYLREDVRGFLADHDLKIEDVDRWISHPGGPKVIDAIRDCLGLDDAALALTWESLAEVGNMSSASVLHVLEKTMGADPPIEGHGLLMAMGPGFASELVLLRW